MSFTYAIFVNFIAFLLYLLYVYFCFRAFPFGSDFSLPSFTKAKEFSIQSVMQRLAIFVPSKFNYLLPPHKNSMNKNSKLSPSHSTANPYRKRSRLAWFQITYASLAGHPISCSFLAFMACPCKSISVILLSKSPF